jgi:hypothetical protein
VLVLCGLAVLGSTICGVRWILEHDDLEAFAKPPDSEEIHNERECGGNHCERVWVYASREHDFEQAMELVADAFMKKGWAIRRHRDTSSLPDARTGLTALKQQSEGPYNGPCFSYTDLRTQFELPGLSLVYRAEFEDELAQYRAVIVVTKC